MNGEKSSRRLYRDLMGCKADTRREVVIYSFVFVLLAALSVTCVVGVCDSEGIVSALGLAAILVLSIGSYSFLSLRKLKKLIAANRKKEERANALTEMELSSLEAHIAEAELRYKTFYMLDDYLYVPKIRLLIRYSEISGFANVLHKYNNVTDGMIMEITDTDGILYKAWVKQWKKYEKDCRFVAQEIYDKTEAAKRGLR